MEENLDREFHPFCNGKIVTNLENGNIRVIAGGKAFVITEIAVDGVTLKPPGNAFSSKYTFYSKIEDLEQARSHIPLIKEMN